MDRRVKQIKFAGFDKRRGQGTKSRFSSESLSYNLDDLTGATCSLTYTAPTNSSDCSVGYNYSDCSVGYDSSDCSVDYNSCD